MLTELAELAKEVEVELAKARARRGCRRSPDELRALVEGYLGELAFTPELGGLEEALRYPLESGGKRVRPVHLRSRSARRPAAVAEHCLPAAAAVELVHTFSLVHDDLPAMDDDDERRGRPSAHIAFGEATALLAGDALLAEAFRLALSYPTPMVGPRARAGDAPRHQSAKQDGWKRR